MDSSTLPGTYWPTERIPRGAWLLASAAAMALVAGTVLRGFIGPAWFFNWSLVGQAVPSALPFLVAAAIIAGAHRWPTARGSLLIAAGLFVVHGVLQLALDAWFAWWQSATQGPPDDATQAIFYARALVSEVALAGGFAAVAAALWRSGHEQRFGHGWRRPAIVAAIVLGLAAVAGSVRLAGLAVGVSVSGSPTLDAAPWLLSALQLAAATAIIVSALHARPLGPPMPELVIAAGAALFVAGQGGTDWLLAALPTESLSAELILALAWLEVVGVIVLAAGFISARLFPAPRV